MTRIEAGRKLLDELGSGLEAGEDKPTTPLARKAMRLAALLGMRRYQLLFQLHLDGVKKNAVADPGMSLTEFEGEQRAREMYGLDRVMPNGTVQNHKLHAVDELLVSMEKASEDFGTQFTDRPRKEIARPCTNP